MTREPVRITVYIEAPPVPPEVRVVRERPARDWEKRQKRKPRR